MNKLEVTLEIITPLFLGGADPRGEPELRPPSFRGALRFWFRALLGGVLGIDTKKIFEKESEIFGSTEYASSLLIRVQVDNLYKKKFSKLIRNKPTKQGIAYLFFSARATKHEPERSAFDANQKFKLSISYHNGIEAAYASLWLLTHLGGLGSRSRRGGGNLQVLEPTEAINAEFPKLTVSAKNPRELQDELAQGLKQLRKWAAKQFNGSLNPAFRGKPDFVVLHPDYCRIWVIDQTFNTWDEALNEFGLKMQRFRNRRSPDYENVKAVVMGHECKLQPVQRAAFGLPIVFFYPSLKGQTAILEGSKHDRRASPLIVKVVKLADNRKYVLVIVQFINPLLPQNEKLKLRTDKFKLETQQPTATILEEFIQKLEDEFASRLLIVNYEG